MKKTLVGLLAVVLSLTAMSCDSPFASIKGQNDSKNVEREEFSGKFRLKTSEMWGSFPSVNITGVAHTGDHWGIDIYYHETAKGYWGIIQTYSTKVLGDKASIEYVEDKRSGLHYDHWHWYLVVDGIRIAEYEKIGGTASAANDHIRLLKTHWDFSR